jgi:hypothetical protein
VRYQYVNDKISSVSLVFINTWRITPRGGLGEQIITFVAFRQQAQEIFEEAWFGCLA